MQLSLLSTGSSPTRRVPTHHRNLSNLNDKEFEKASLVLSLAVTLRKALESKTHDRRWHKVKVYKDCFLHTDAVEWMMAHLEAAEKQADQVAAVAKLNELIDAGYVSHVCNEHRFKPDKKAVLFFRFHNKVIDSDLNYVEKREGKSSRHSRGLCTEDIVHEETVQLKLAVDRLTASMKKYSEHLDEAHGRIVLLEEAVGSLGFAFGVIVIVTAIVALCHAVPDKIQGKVKLALSTVALALLMWSQSGKNMLFIVSQHASVLLKLMRPSAELEDAFMADIATEECLAEKTSTRRVSLLEGPHPTRSSLYQHMTKAFSLKHLSSSRGFDETEDGRTKMREAWDLPDPSKWPHRPVFVCVNTPISSSLTVPKYGKGPCPLGVPFEFSSDLFEGKCLVRLKDVPSDDPNSDESYFLGRRRRFQSIVQGRFKKPLKVSEVLTGHEFVRPLQRLPPSWMVRAGSNLIKRIAPGTQIDLNDPQPKAMSILAATSQAVSADMPGNEPNIASHDISEDASLLGGYFAEGTISASNRKRHLADPKRAEKYTYDTESIYTFDFYQQLLDVGTYSLDLGFTKIGLTKSLDGQPIQVLCKTTEGKYLWSFQIWHEALLEGAAKQ